MERFLERRRRLLEGPEPIRAFATNPTTSYHQLSGTSGNAEAHMLLTASAWLERLADRAPCSLASLAPGLVLFVVAWEPYCAKAIGSLFEQVHREPSLCHAIVFLDDEPAQALADRKRSAWYFQRAFVLPEEASALRSAIHRTPWLVELDAACKIVREAEGAA